MRVLFLDFDGVLNSRDYVQRAGWEPPLGSADDERLLDPEAIAHLNVVVRATGAHVVVSSSWRITYALDVLRSLLERRGFVGRVLDVTPELSGRQRSREIAQWLLEHGEVDAFAIVDDDESAGVGYASQFVNTAFDDGLTRAHARRLVQILNRGARPRPARGAEMLYSVAAMTRAAAKSQRAELSKSAAPKSAREPANVTAMRAGKENDPVFAARRALLEGVGMEVAASFPGITRLGGQIVAALYLADVPGSHGRSMDELSAELGRSKSNIFANLRALEAAGVVERRRSAGARHDRFALRGPYPDVLVGAYISRLRRVVADKRALVDRALSLLGEAREAREAQGEEAAVLRSKLDDLGRKYGRFGDFFQRVGPALDTPIDLEPLLRDLPPEILDAIGEMVRAAYAKK